MGKFLSAFPCIHLHATLVPFHHTELYLPTHPCQVISGSSVGGTDKNNWKEEGRNWDKGLSPFSPLSFFPLCLSSSCHQTAILSWLLAQPDGSGFWPLETPAASIFLRNMGAPGVASLWVVSPTHLPSINLVYILNFPCLHGLHD